MLRVHFSCGAASAVSLLLAVRQSNNVDAVYADTGGEHPDNHEPFDMSCDMFCSDIAERA